MEEKTQEDILLELLEKRTDWEAIRNPFGKGVYFRAGELFGQKLREFRKALKAKKDIKNKVMNTISFLNLK